ncbi:MAG: N-acetyltransferase [Candidatus Omnitrophica bacterium]|nr:N-acetyltransferase [Candidatus Omnitrophota bacterium]
MSEQNYFVHPSSYIDRDASIGDDTRVWHFCHVMSGARIGRNCNIGQNVFVGRNVLIGNNVKIQNNVSVYDGVTLKDDVFCGPSCVFTNIINPRAAIQRNSAEHYRKTTVEKGATIGANATIICGVTIGRYALIGAGAVVTKDVADYGLVLGSPARRKGWACECGETLKFTKNKSTCKSCKRKYSMSSNKVRQL